METLKSYSELIKIPTFKGRLEYLQTGNEVGIETFGFNRYLNQILYKSTPWRKFRNDVIMRDLGCDMALLDFPIDNSSENSKRKPKIIIHHINPLSETDLINKRVDRIFDFNNVVCVSERTHKLIHYLKSIDDLDIFDHVERSEGDTNLW